MVTFSNSTYEISRIDNEINNESITEEEKEEEEEDEDERSTRTDGSSEDEEEEMAVDLTKNKPSFGNISVANSSDVHFGNKTFYQGPVTIKQIVYAKNKDDPSLNDLRDERLALDCAKINEGFVADEGEGGKNRYLENNNRNNGISEESLRSLCHKWKNSLSRQQYYIVIGAISITFLASLLVVTFTLLDLNHLSRDDKGKKIEEEYIGTPIESPVDPDAFNATTPNNVKIISRLEWLAQPPVQTPNELEITPVPYVIIWHTATENCSDQASCTFHVRFIQTFHIDSRHWWDIAYNFLVGGDGNAYEGRGWKREGSHTFDYNKKSIGIAFIGTFINIKPPEWQLNACKVLIDIGVKKGFIREDYKLLAARQLTGTQAPGDLLYEEMKTWPHWVKKP